MVETNITAEILSFQNLFILTKYHMFWLSYECFSILCNAFLLKSAISSHNSCVQGHIFQYISNVFHDLHQQCLPCLWESKKFSGNGISLNFPNRKFI